MDTNRRPSLCRLQGVLSRYPGKKSQLYQDIEDGLMTPPVKLGPRFSAWPEHELDIVIAARTAGLIGDELRSLVSRLVTERKAQYEALVAREVAHV